MLKTTYVSSIALEILHAMLLQLHVKIINLVINSEGRGAVRDSTINCPDNNNCTMNGTQANHGYRDSLVNCGINGSCYFLFEYVNGVTNFHFFTMNATYSRYVKIYKYGNPGSSASVSSAIYCQ